MCCWSVSTGWDWVSIQFQLSVQRPSSHILHQWFHTFMYWCRHITARTRACCFCLCAFSHIRVYACPFLQQIVDYFWLHSISSSDRAAERSLPSQQWQVADRSTASLRDTECCGLQSSVEFIKASPSDEYRELVFPLMKRKVFHTRTHNLNSSPLFRALPYFFKSCPRIE